MPTATMYGIASLVRLAAGANADLGDWLCKVMGICA
jgi:hypothetical protein